jgi:hypothetical protein
VNDERSQPFHVMASTVCGVGWGPTPGDGDYLESIAATRATVSSDAADEFLQDIRLIARV